MKKIHTTEEYYKKNGERWVKITYFNGKVAYKKVNQVEFIN